MGRMCLEMCRLEGNTSRRPQPPPALVPASALLPHLSTTPCVPHRERPQKWRAAKTTFLGSRRAARARRLMMALPSTQKRSWGWISRAAATLTSAPLTVTAATEAVAAAQHGVMPHGVCCSSYRWVSLHLMGGCVCAYLALFDHAAAQCTVMCAQFIWPPAPLLSDPCDGRPAGEQLPCVEMCAAYGWCILQWMVSCPAAADLRVG